MIDMSGVIESFITGTYTVVRPGASTYGADGRQETETPTTFSVDAVVQPATGPDLERLPQGYQGGMTWTIWSTGELRLRDIITVAGEDFQVASVDEWNVSGNYWRVLAVKVSLQP